MKKGNGKKLSKKQWEKENAILNVPLSMGIYTEELCEWEESE